MKKESFFQFVSLGALVIALAACGAKGIDRKLDYTGTEEDLGKSYGNAMVDATPEQQNILRERMPEILLSVLFYAKNSNPAVVDAFIAKRNAEEFDRLSKKTVRELFVWHLEKRQSDLNTTIPALEKFHKDYALKYNGFEIARVNRGDAINDYTSSMNVEGVLHFRNDSDTFDFDFRGCQLAVALDGKMIEELKESNDCSGTEIIKVNGGQATIKFNHNVSGKENVKVFYDLFKSGQLEKISFRAKASKNSYLKSSANQNLVFDADDKKVQELQEQLQKITSDLAAIKT